MPHPLGKGHQRGKGRWVERLESQRRWVYVVDLLPPGVGTNSDEYRALHRAARTLASEGRIQMVRFSTGRYRVAVGPLARTLDL